MQSPNPTSFTANEIIKGGARVALRSDGKIELADAAVNEIGVALLYNGKDSYAVGDSVGVLLFFQSVLCIADGAITAYETVGRAADGKVKSGSGFGIAAEAAAADGDTVEVYRLPLPTA